MEISKDKIFFPLQGLLHPYLLMMKRWGTFVLLKLSGIYYKEQWRINLMMNKMRN
jgi:hypothetical protein